MEKNRLFVEKVVREFVNPEYRQFDMLYLYGDSAATASWVDAAEELYRAQNPGTRIVRTTGEAYVRRLWELARAGGLLTAGEMYQCDLFLLEDIGFVAARENCEQFLYGILDWLLEHGKKILITGTVPVLSMAELAPRIQAQITGGLVCPVD